MSSTGEMRLSVNGEDLAMWRAQIPAEYLGSIFFVMPAIQRTHTHL